MIHQIANLMSSYGEQLSNELDKLKVEQFFKEDKLSKSLEIVSSHLLTLAILVGVNNPSAEDIATKINDIKENLNGFSDRTDFLKTDETLSYKELAEKITQLLILYDNQKTPVIDNKERIKKIQEQNSAFFKEQQKASYTQSSSTPEAPSLSLSPSFLQKLIATK